MNHIKYQLWPVLFGRQAGGLETFIGDRKHSKTGKELKEHVVYDINPIYDIKFCSFNLMF